MLGRFLRDFVGNDDGQDLIEYALLTGFIALGSVALMLQLGTELNAAYEGIGEALDDAGCSGGGGGSGVGGGGAGGCGSGGGGVGGGGGGGGEGGGGGVGGGS